MVKIIKKNNFWYLYYSYKENKKTKNIEKYIGRELPKNILLIKSNFEEEAFRKRFGNRIEKTVNMFKRDFSKYTLNGKNKYFSQFVIKFTYNSQAIEGSTLNLKDTAFLIEEGVSPKKKIEDINLSKTHYEVFSEILKLKVDLSEELIIDFHNRLFKNIYPDISGKYRKHTVKVIGSKSIFTNPSRIRDEMRSFLNWYKKEKNNIHPLRLAALVHLKFVSIHPFTDGNGRMSRLLMNYVLHLNDLPLLDIDYKKRNSYYNSLEKDQVNKTEYAFVDFITKKFLKDYEKGIN